MMKVRTQNTEKYVESKKDSQQQEGDHQTKMINKQ